MKATHTTTTSPHPAIALIAAKIEAHHALQRDFDNDKTLTLAESALETAKAASVQAELEDAAVDPEKLVDLRIEARRQVEIAEIRLSRAKTAMESQASRVLGPIREGGRIAAEALLEVVEPFGAAFESELCRVIGKSDFEKDQGHYKTLIYRKKDRFHGLARELESSPSIHSLNRAVAMIEDAARLG
jgi:hypothetical protein